MAAYRPRRAPEKWLVGAPAHVLACYDFGPSTVDRYTVLMSPALYYPQRGWSIPAIASSTHPFSPQGFGQHIELPPYAGRRALGKRIAWADLPADVQKFAQQWAEE